MAVLLFLLLIYSSFSQTFSERKLNISLQLQPRKIAYSLKEDKKFFLIFKNNYSVSQTITLADNYVHSIVIEALDAFDVSLAVKPTILTQRNNPKILYRTLTLLPNEEFSFEIDINDYFMFLSVGTYKISLRYYPQFYSDRSLSQQYIASNSLVVSVVDFPSSTIANIPQDSLNQDPSYAERVLYQPNEIVFYAFSALKEMSWKKFFSFLDIKRFYLNTVADNNAFSFLSSLQQRTELKKFKERIMKGKDKSDLSKIDYFSIEETQFTQNNANVEVLTQDRGDLIIVFKRYTIRLMRLYNVWKIVDYDIKVVARKTRTDKENSFGNVNNFVSPDEMSINN